MRKFAIEYQQRALQLRQVYHLAPPANPASLELLVLMAPGDMTSNTPVDCLLEGADIKVTLLYVLPGRPLPTPLPDHDVIFVAIGESSATRYCPPGSAMPPASAKPVVNLPDRIARLTRDRVSELCVRAGAVMPATVLAKRRGPRQGSTRRNVARRDHGGGRFPIIVRPPDSQGGKDLVKSTAWRTCRPTSPGCRTTSSTFPISSTTAPATGNSGSIGSCWSTAGRLPATWRFRRTG